MRQFILPEDWKAGSTCRVEGGRARYLLRVLRLAPGDSLAGLDGQGRRRPLEVTETGPDYLVFSVGEPEKNAATAPLPDTHGSRGKKGERRAMAKAPQMTRPPAIPDREGGTNATGWPRLILVQSILKSQAMDLVVRQAAEAGVARIIPLAARRSVARAETSGAGGDKRARWERIVREGLQQSGSAISTIVEDPLALAALSAQLGSPRGTRLKLLFHEAPLAEGSLHGYLGMAPDEIVLCIGPEGGFAPEETAFLIEEGFMPLRLPGAVLKAETAAIFAVAAIETVFLERNSWTPFR